MSKLGSFSTGKVIARRYRNRRIGEFLKELRLTEGRATGIPTIIRAMQQNGSPPHRFETDDNRTYFLIELPIHPAALNHQQDHAEDHAELSQTELQILRLLKDGSRSRLEIATALGYTGRSGNLLRALERLRKLYIIAFTIPEKPRSEKQKFKLTEQGSKRSETL